MSDDGARERELAREWLADHPGFDMDEFREAGRQEWAKVWQARDEDGEFSPAPAVSAMMDRFGIIDAGTVIGLAELDSDAMHMADGAEGMLAEAEVVAAARAWMAGDPAFSLDEFGAAWREVMLRKADPDEPVLIHPDAELPLLGETVVRVKMTPEGEADSLARISALADRFGIPSEEVYWGIHTLSGRRQGWIFDPDGPENPGAGGLGEFG